MVLEIRMVVNIGRGIVTRNMHEWCFGAPCNAVILDLGASYTDVLSLLIIGVYVYDMGTFWKCITQ